MRGSLVVLLAMSLFAARASSAQSTDAATKADDKQCLERPRGNPSDSGLANRADPTQQGNKNCLPPVLGHATINGVVSFDLDQNGMLGSEEVGISGWQVQLSGPVTQTVMTDASGAFSFSGLTAGDYTVCVLPPAGWDQIPPVSAATTPCATGIGYKITAPVSPVDVTLPPLSFGYVSQ